MKGNCRSHWGKPLLGKVGGRRDGTIGSFSGHRVGVPGNSMDVWSHEHEELDHIRAHTRQFGDDTGTSCSRTCSRL